jgi:hypothetical protein
MEIEYQIHRRMLNDDGTLDPWCAITGSDDEAKARACLAAMRVAAMTSPYRREYRLVKVTLEVMA